MFYVGRIWAKLSLAQSSDRDQIVLDYRVIFFRTSLLQKIHRKQEIKYKHPNYPSSCSSPHPFQAVQSSR